MMESIEDILANLDVIQKNISSSNTSADIASVQYVCKNIDEYNNSDKNTKIVLKGLNILHDSILLLAQKTKDNGYLHTVVKGILKCIHVNDLYRMVDSVILELAEDKNIFETIKGEINVCLDAQELPEAIRARFTSLQMKVVKKMHVEVTDDLSGDLNFNSTNLSLNESPRSNNDMLTIKSLPNGSDSTGQRVSFTPRLLNISFMPQSLTEQWALAKGPEEVSVLTSSFCSVHNVFRSEGMSPSHVYSCSGRYPWFLMVLF